MTISPSFTISQQCFNTRLIFQPDNDRGHPKRKVGIRVYKNALTQSLLKCFGFAVRLQKGLYANKKSLSHWFQRHGKSISKQELSSSHLLVTKINSVFPRERRRVNPPRGPTIAKGLTLSEQSKLDTICFMYHIEEPALLRLKPKAKALLLAQETGLLSHLSLRLSFDKLKEWAEANAEKKGADALSLFEFFLTENKADLQEIRSITHPDLQKIVCNDWIYFKMRLEEGIPFSACFLMAVADRIHDNNVIEPIMANPELAKVFELKDPELEKLIFNKDLLKLFKTKKITLEDILALSLEQQDQLRNGVILKGLSKWLNAGIPWSSIAKLTTDDWSYLSNLSEDIQKIAPCFLIYFDETLEKLKTKEVNKEKLNIFDDRDLITKLKLSDKEMKKSALIRYLMTIDPYLLGREIYMRTPVKRNENGMKESMVTFEKQEVVPFRGSITYTYQYGKRIDSNGTLEQGLFLEGTLKRGTQVTKGGKTLFFDPDLFVKPETDLFFNPQRTVTKKGSINFAHVFLKGKVQLIAVECTENKTYKTYEGCNEEAMVHLALNSHGNLKSLLSSPDLNIDEAKLIQLLQRPSEKLGGSIPLFHLDSSDLEAALFIAKKQSVKLDLHTPDQKTGKTLLSKYAGMIMAAPLIALILEIDPEAIRNPKESYFTRALTRGCDQTGFLLLKTLKNQQIPLTTEEEWLKKAYQNDLSFTDEEFLKLDIKLKKDLYRIANIFANDAFVLRLNGLGMEEKPLDLKGPAILSENMDVVRVKNAIKTFLMELRQKDALFTEDEFQEYNQKNYVDKGLNIGRILGRNFVEDRAKKLGLTTIKVPKKIAVIKNNSEMILIHLDEKMELLTSDLHVYSEQIHPVNRKMTPKENEELKRIISDTGYRDLHPNNFIIANDGIYFIDTEYSNFLQRQDEEEQKLNEENRARLGFKHRYKPFLFPVKELLKNTKKLLLE